MKLKAETKSLNNIKLVHLLASVINLRADIKKEISNDCI